MKHFAAAPPIVSRGCPASPFYSNSGGGQAWRDIAHYSAGAAATAPILERRRAAKRIETALRQREVDPCSIAAIFVTHEHSDHVCGLKILTKRYGIPVFASPGTLEALLEADALSGAYDAIPEEGMEAAGMWVEAFRTSHDSRESLGYRVCTPDDRRLAVATDMGYMSDTVRFALSGCDLVQIESNHDVRMLENGPYPYYLKRRILADTGHLSNEVCAASLPGLAESGTTRFYLAHLSKDNNTPEVAYITSQAALNQAGMKEGQDYLLRVAPRYDTEPMLVF